MANDVKIRFHTFLPGAGKDASGNPKQGKTRVVGIIDVTSYSGGEGEPFVAADVKLTTIDSMQLRVRDELGAAGGFTRQAHYSQSTGHFYLSTTLWTTGVVSKVAPAATETIEFVAEGDSAHDVELLP